VEGVPADTPGGSLENSALLQRLGDVSLWDLEVVEVSSVTPSMRRIVCTAPGLADLSHQPGQDLMLAIPAAQGASFRRRYTIRSLDPARSRVTLDIVLHGDGPGARWAASVEPGSHIEAIGPRGKIVVDEEADWHLFVGDESAVPASLAMAESLGGDRSIVVLEVDSDEDRQEATVPLPVQWIFRKGADPASSGLLLTALGEIEFPSGRGHAYVAGELGVVAQLRRHLLERGLATDQVSSKPYWRAGVANAAHGEPERT
jgi:NADPH-dependent ferric siderophore reductase